MVSRSCCGEGRRACFLKDHTPVYVHKRGCSLAALHLFIYFVPRLVRACVDAGWTWHPAARGILSPRLSPLACAHLDR